MAPNSPLLLQKSLLWMKHPDEKDIALWRYLEPCKCPESIRDRRENTHCSLSNVSVAHSRENVTKAWRNWTQRWTFAVRQSSFTTAWALRFWRGRELSILLWTALSPAPPLLSPSSRPRTILQGSQLGYTFLTAQWLSNLIWNNLFESFFIKIQME